MPLGSTHRIAPRGELDLATGSVLERELLRVEDTAAEVIEVDLSGVTFIDCAAIRVLTNAHARVNRNCLRLRFKPGPPAVQRVLALVGADKTLPFHGRHSPGRRPSPGACRDAFRHRMESLSAAGAREDQTATAGTLELGSRPPCVGELPEPG